jgi:hypothetical protein
MTEKPILDPPNIGIFDETLPDAVGDVEKSYNVQQPIRLISKQPPRPGLVPQSGDPEHPKHWIRPPQKQPPVVGQVKEIMDDLKPNTRDFVLSIVDRYEQGHGLSPKQQSALENIVSQHQSPDTTSQLIGQVKERVDKLPPKTQEFVRSVVSQYERRGSISPKQQEALERIVSSKPSTTPKPQPKPSTTKPKTGPDYSAYSDEALTSALTAAIRMPARYVTSPGTGKTVNQKNAIIADLTSEIERRKGLKKSIGIRYIQRQGPPGPPPRPGLQWKPETHRWIRPHTGEEFEHTDYSFPEVFQNYGPLKPAQKRKIQKQLVDKYGDDPDFKVMAEGLAFYTQGFFDDIRNVAAAMVSDTIEDLEANALGFFRDHLDKGTENPTMTVSIFAGIKDIYGRTDEDTEDLKSVKYNNAKEYAASLIHAIESAPATEEPLYRGLLLRHEGLLPQVEIGDEFDLPEPSSFSRDNAIAEKFAYGWIGKGSRRKPLQYGEVPLVIKIEGENKAVDIDVFSSWQQQEALTNGTFEVIGYDKSYSDERPAVLTLRQKTVAGSNWPKGKGVEYPFPKEIVGKLSRPDFEVISRLRQTNLGDWGARVGTRAEWEKQKADPAKILTAIEQLGFVYEDDGYAKKKEEAV